MRDVVEALATLLGAALLLVSLPAPPVDAGSAAARQCDRYAAPAGSNRASGSARHPVRTADRLARRLRRGETGCLRAGVYNFDLLSLKKPRITLRPLGQENVTLRGDIKILPSARRAALIGMRLDGEAGMNQIGPRIYADGALLRGNTITNHHTGICVQVSAFYNRPPPSGVRIKGNRIHDCGTLPSTNHHHGIYVVHARRTMITGNWIYGNADRGVQLYPSAQSTVVRGNVIDSNGEGVSIGGDDAGSCSNGNTVTGNVISNPMLGWNVYSGAQGPDCFGNVVRSNCLFAGQAESPHHENGGVLSPARSFTASGNRIANPRYVDPESGDYRLREHSPCKRLLASGR
jgi:parallel beta-helix repeat protein